MPIPAFLYRLGRDAALIHIDAMYLGGSPEAVALQIHEAQSPADMNLALEPDGARRLADRLHDALRERGPEFETFALKLRGSGHSQVFVSERSGPSCLGQSPLYTTELTAGQVRVVAAALMSDLWYRVATLLDQLALLGTAEERRGLIAATVEADETLVSFLEDFAGEIPAAHMAPELRTLATEARRRGCQIGGFLRADAKAWEVQPQPTELLRRCAKQMAFMRSVIECGESFNDDDNRGYQALRDELWAAIDGAPYPPPRSMDDIANELAPLLDPDLRAKLQAELDRIHRKG